MLNLKKTAVAVLAFGSSAAFAGTMGPVCTPGNVTVPCESTAWDIGIQALYLKSTYNDRGFGYIGEITNADNTHTRLVSADPDWGWGFKLEASYHFGTGNDINLNWYHLSSTGTTQNFGSGFVYQGGLDEAGDDTPFNSQAVTIDPRWDAVNLEFGQHADFGVMKNIRFHGGVQYARIKTDAAWLASGDEGIYGSVRTSSKYTGFGPRIGADYAYDLGNGLAMYAKGAGAILVGDHDFSGNGVVGQTGVDQQSLGFSSDSKTSIVPEVEAKLGLAYTYAMAQGDLSLDAGWMWVNYFNAQTSFDLNTSDFGVQGPYVGLKWVGSVV